MGCVASRASVMTGGATHAAALKVRAKALEMAAELLQAREDELDIVDGVVVRRDRQEGPSIALGEIARHLLGEGLPGEFPFVNGAYQQMYLRSANGNGEAGPFMFEMIGDFDGLAIRSATKVTVKLLEKAKKLRVVGRAGIGVDNVDIPAATAKGIPVLRAPGRNADAVAELHQRASAWFEANGDALQAISTTRAALP